MLRRNFQNSTRRRLVLMQRRARMFSAPDSDQNIPDCLQRACHAMKPRTVVGWWRQWFRRYWRSISQGKPGRKGLSIELRKLIRRMSLENPLWGGAKIRDALVDLGYERLDVGTIRKYMKKRSNAPSGTWKAFLRNHMNVAWGMDFCVVRSVGFKALYVFVIIEHGRRKIRRIAVTETPNAGDPFNWSLITIRDPQVQPRLGNSDGNRTCGQEEVNSWFQLVATNRRWCANVTNERSTPESRFLNSARLNDGALSLSTGRFNTRATHIQCCPSPTERVLVWSGGLSFETS